MRALFAPGLLLALLLAGPAHGGASRGQPAQVTAVSDGDSIWVRMNGRSQPQRVRLRGIDAPEACQPHGPAAREALRSQVLGRTVLLHGRGSDDYGRLLRQVASDSQPDVGAWMVSEGHAWSYRSGRRAGPYDAQQARARAAGRGLWSRPEPKEPRTFRRVHGPCH